MRVVIQRVAEASVTIDGVVKSEIGQGYLILLGVETEDTASDAEWLCSKVTGLRIFDDSNGIMNLSIQQIEGEVLVISQFTLHAQTKKGNRPSYIKAAKHDLAIPLYAYFCKLLSKNLQKEVKTGIFAADMKVALINDGPVTILIDSKNKE